MSTASILNDLITICKDGEQGFLKVTEEVTEQKLKTAFTDRAKGCKEAATELQQHVKDLGEEPTDSGSILGALHRGWIEVKSAVTDRSTREILEECEKGETAAKEAYSKALEADLPANIRTVIEKQFAAVEENYNLVRTFRDEYAQAD